MMRRYGTVAFFIAIGLFAAGCPKGQPEYSAARKALDAQDYDAAVDYYLKALKDDPHNANYKIGLNQARLEAGQLHLHNGLKLRDKGDLQGAVSEFQRSQVLDPSNPAADQAIKQTVEMIAERSRAESNAEEPLIENGQ